MRLSGLILTYEDLPDYLETLFVTTDTSVRAGSPDYGVVSSAETTSKALLQNPPPLQ